MAPEWPRKFSQGFPGETPSPCISFEGTELARIGSPIFEPDRLRISSPFRAQRLFRLTQGKPWAKFFFGHFGPQAENVQIAGAPAEHETFFSLDPAAEKVVQKGVFGMPASSCYRPKIRAPSAAFLRTPFSIYNLPTRNDLYQHPGGPRRVRFYHDNTIDRGV